MECVPTDSAEVLNVALPLMRVPVPSVAPPFLKVTGPVGVPVVVDFTVAVKVTAVPKADGFFEETTDVVVAALVIGACVTVSVCLRLLYPVVSSQTPSLANRIAYSGRADRWVQHPAGVAKLIVTRRYIGY